jgi:hypothetical protein
MRIAIVAIGVAALTFLATQVVNRGMEAMATQLPGQQQTTPQVFTLGFALVTSGVVAGVAAANVALSDRSSRRRDDD